MSFISEVDILDESKDCFLTYAEEVLTDRAIPAAEDGLLSAQRKILWTMEDHLKMSSKSKTKKCNAIVGSTLATSYYHGDAACYGVLCKMSQDYLMRYPLITGQGSLGTQESNDMVASSRYTEAKPSIYTDLMMEDYNKDVVPKKETYNNEFYEPVVLPSLFPNAICNGRQAIGISMSHSSPSHNLTEVCNAIIAYIKNNNITIDEILEIMPGPDFPLENTIINKNDIKEAFAIGKSKTSLKVRGEYEIKDRKIIFNTIPYRTYRNKIKEQINDNVDELSEYIEDFDDESGVGKNRLIFTIKSGCSPQKALDKLFSLTDLQTTVSYNLNYIVNGTPKLCSILDLIKAYYNHQIDIILKATSFDKDKAQKRAHIIEGLLIAIEDIDKAIKIIRGSDNKEIASNELIKYFKITSEQANAILEMKLAKLTKLDKDDLLKELKSKYDIINECNKIIEDSIYRDSILINKIINMRDKYGDSRRTKLLNLSVSKESKEEITIIPEDVVVVLNQNNEIKRIPKRSFKLQRRNGIGVKSNDTIINTIVTNTIDNLMIFTSKGKMHKLLVDNVPVGTNTTRGTNIRTLTKIAADENVLAMISVDKSNLKNYVVFFTKKGMIKKSCIEEYLDMKKSGGVVAITLKDDDELTNVVFMDDEEVILTTKNGMAIRFETSNIAPLGRVAAGVKAIKLSDNDEVICGCPIFNEDKYLLTVTENGLGKKTDLSMFPLQGRYGKGIICHKTSDYPLKASCLIKDNSNILLTGSPSSICIAAADISTTGRLVNGYNLIKNSTISSIVVL